MCHLFTKNDLMMVVGFPIWEESTTMGRYEHVVGSLQLNKEKEVVQKVARCESRDIAMNLLCETRCIYPPFFDA